MTDRDLPSKPAPILPDTVAQVAVDRAEAAATRRRWVGIAELVGVAGLVIAALGLWTGWSDRRADDAARQAGKAVAAVEARARTLVMLKGTPDGDDLTLADARHDVQTIDLRWPTSLGVAAAIGADPAIDARLVAAPLLDLTDGGPDDRTGRLPVLITARYWDADLERRDTAIYDVAWATEGRFGRGRALRLKGLKLRERTSSLARLDAIWATEKPKPAQ